jgi:CRISPR/Cas system CSM-associated protein Csm2 small subunit
MLNWEVQVLTESGQIKNVRVDGYAFRPDAERAALSSSGAKKVIISNPKEYKDNTQIQSQTLDNHYYQVPVYKEPEETYDSTLDEMEEEMYDLMCQLAMSKGEELPTVEEFYEWLEELDYD